MNEDESRAKKVPTVLCLREMPAGSSRNHKEMYSQKEIGLGEINAYLEPKDKSSLEEKKPASGTN